MPASLYKFPGHVHASAMPAEPQPPEVSAVPGQGQAAKRLSALVFSPDPSVHGGVSTFVQMMKQNLAHTDTDAFWIGAPQEEKEGFARAAWRLLAVPAQAAWRVRQKHYDVVHLNPSLTYRSVLRDWLILLALRLAGCRQVMVYFHGWQFKVEKRLATTPGLRQLTAWLLNGCGHIMVLAPEFKQALVAMGVDEARITFTRTMFDGQAIREAEASVTPPARRSILFMSRFVYQKGVHELAEAFARLAEEYPDLDLIFAGDGPERAKLEAFAKDKGLSHRILFPGYVGGREKYAMLLGCTIYALPTYLTEGMPVALLEAMGAGKPLLTAKAGAIPHIIFDPENGVVLEHVTAETVETALRRLLGDKAYCEKVGEHNRAYAWERFEAANVTHDIETAYRRIAGL